MNRPLHRRLNLEALELRQLLAVDIVFDYSHDSSSFFNNSTSDGRSARAALEAAATFFEARLSDTLLPIVPSGANTWSALFDDPSTGESRTKTDLTINANQILVYVGARNLPGNTIGTGGPGGYRASGNTQTWFDTVQARGQTGALGPQGTQTDFSTWGGSITFDNADVNWNFGGDPPATNETDFYSTALHELAHVLGFGTASSWRNLVQSGRFIGARSVAQNGGPVPVNASSGHWAEDTTGRLHGSGSIQEAAMDPSIRVGSRKLFTELDFAGLDDLGWNVVAPPAAAVPIIESSGSTAVVEGGATDTLSLSLSRLSTEDVVVTITPGAQLDLGNGAGTPLEITFAPLEGLTSRSIQVRAFDDAQIEGNHSDLLSFSTSSLDRTFNRLVISPITVDIADNDFNEPPTDIRLSNSQIDENGEIGKTVGSLTTVDADAADTFIYSLLGNEHDNDLFAIEQDRLLANVAFDFETRSNYQVQIRSTDSAGEFVDKVFDIEVQDVNEIPTNLNLSSNKILSGAPIGNEVGTLSASDPDEGDVIAFELVDGAGSADNASFQIVDNTLVSQDTFDAASQPTLSVRVAAIDSIGASTESTFTIQVIAEEDLPVEDVNADFTVSALDVLVIINHINRTGGGVLKTGENRRFDVTGDGNVTPLDVLLVINFFNSNGEGENNRLDPIQNPEPESNAQSNDDFFRFVDLTWNWTRKLSS